jgi:endonuclease/exonuclease/phosphatase family metal-dependent hydrolase
MKPLRLLSYNIHKGMNFLSLEYILEKIRDEIRKLDIDFVFLQEVHGHHILYENQFEFLADQVWPHHAYGKNAIYTDGHHGNSVLSKFPFISWENIDVSDHALEKRGILHGIIRVPHLSCDLHVVCVHFGLFEKSRRNQTQKLIEHIQKNIPADDPLIIAGDFNDWQERCTHQLETDLGVSEVFKTLQGRHAKTFPSFFPVLRMDRIYIKNLTPLKADALKDAPWTQLSDHLALLADLKPLDSNHR